VDKKTFARLVNDLQRDTDLFHAFIFHPEVAVSRLPYLDEPAKRMLRVLDPRTFIADAAGLLSREVIVAACGPDTTCSCTASTCGGVTCGGSTCDVTCGESSCGNTRGESCGTTTLDIAAVWDDAYIAFD
jgi:hypothetical protein